MACFLTLIDTVCLVSDLFPNFNWYYSSSIWHLEFFCLFMQVCLIASFTRHNPGFLRLVLIIPCGYSHSYHVQYVGIDKTNSQKIFFCLIQFVKTNIQTEACFFKHSTGKGIVFGKDVQNNGNSLNTSEISCKTFYFTWKNKANWLIWRQWHLYRFLMASKLFKSIFCRNFII